MRTFAKRVAFSICLALLFAAPASAEFTCELSFPAAPSTPLANFPALVRISSSAPSGFDYADCPTSSCLWFTDANDNTLPFDVDTWDTTSNSLVWVSVPSLSSSATITMHWDSSGAPAGQPDSTNVWSRASYVGVWHMNEILEDTTKGTHYTPDASGKGWHAYKANENDTYPAPISVAGNAATPPPTGRAINNSNGDSTRTTGGFLVPASATSGTTISRFTISLFEENTVESHDRAVAIGGTATGANEWNNGCLTANKQESYVMAPLNGGYANFFYNDGLADNAWRHIAGVFNSSLSGYVDGVYKDLNKSTIRYSVTLNYGLGIGTFVNQHAQTFSGYLDEIRIRNAPSTAEWIVAERATVMDASYVYFAPVDDGSDVLSIGAPLALDITGVSATVSGGLTKLGVGATSAEVWLVVSCGGTTRTVSLGSTNAVPATMSTLLTGLAPLTEYTCYFTATNNASPAVGVDSPSSTFTTVTDVSEWDPYGAVFTTDGRWITARVSVSRLCSGTTTLYLMTGMTAAEENTVSASAVISETGTATISGEVAADVLWAKEVYYSLMLVSDAPGSVVTNWPNASGDVLYDKKYKLQDNSTYTWIGGSSGVWTNTACWNRTTAGNLAPNHPAGFPVNESTAVFATSEGAGPVTVTFPAARGNVFSYENPCWYVKDLNLSGMHSPLVFTSEDLTRTDSAFVIYKFTATQPYNHVVFDACNVITYESKDAGATSADANGGNFTITFKNGSSFYTAVPTGSRVFDGHLQLNRPGRKVVVSDGAVAPVKGDIFGGSASAEAPQVIEIDNATVTTTANTQKVEPDSYNQYNGMVIRLKGADASFSAGYFLPKYANSTNVIEFVIPAGGYNAAPVQTTHNSNVFGETGAKAPMTLRVAKDSPGLASMPKAGVQLLYSKGGINAANVRFEDVKANYNGFFFKDADGNEYADAAAIETAGKTASQITQIWYRPPVRQFVIIVR